MVLIEVPYYTYFSGLTFGSNTNCWVHQPRMIYIHMILSEFGFRHLPPHTNLKLNNLYICQHSLFFFFQIWELGCTLNKNLPTSLNPSHTHYPRLDPNHNRLMANFLSLKINLFSLRIIFISFNPKYNVKIFISVSLHNDSFFGCFIRSSSTSSQCAWSHHSSHR